MPRQIVHGDWHPGNLLFRAGRGTGVGHDEVAAVVDHDTVASWPRVLDVAYGALHFSLPRLRLMGSSERPLTLRDNPDEGRLTAFCRGYHDRCTAPLSSAEAAALPWLMIEAVVADAAAAWAGLASPSPVSSPGVDAAGFLGLIARKAAWLAENAPAVARMARPGANPGNGSSV
jgi:homoserine kinase type II